MTREEEKRYNTIVEYGVATEAELNLVMCQNLDYIYPWHC